jgi:NADH-quinone oxidoreductase subunit I
MLRCIFCGLCEEACPKDAVYLTQTFAPANYARKGFIYGKDDLLIPTQRPIRKATPKQKALLRQAAKTARKKASFRALKKKQR